MMPNETAAATKPVIASSASTFVQFLTRFAAIQPKFLDLYA
jgi:hypothetical protein